jgi:drug/metabolite transporter (DMT)-like permease
MLAFHRNWAFVVSASNIAAGLWGIVLVRKKAKPPPAFWVVLIGGQLALALQVTIGVVMSKKVQPPGAHVFYGFMLVFTAALSWAFRGETLRRTVGVASGVALFVGIVAIRAMFTA